MLPINPPVSPMLARAVSELPLGSGLSYEPKWDGFRAIVFREGEGIVIQSRNGRPLTRYFPELLPPLCGALPERCVVDGEVIISTAKGLDFDALLQRIHPAQSRVDQLAQATPAGFVAFDLLALGTTDLRQEPFRRRRELLEPVSSSTGNHQVVVTPATKHPEQAHDWFSRFEGAGLDGVMIKDLELPYLEGKRVMFKLKHRRSADCVVGGFRWHADGQGVGSLLLGLYDVERRLQHVGVTASFSAAQRRQLVHELEPWRLPEGATDHPWSTAQPDAAPGRRPGAPSRWNAKEDLSFELLRPERVVEVAYDHLQGDRFRHGTTFLRWRLDREPSSCAYDQLQVVVPIELKEIFWGSAGDPR
ncbi:MAG: ATP-dependent DNA ligase [Candidatus Dormibacteria bacterium]